MFVSILQLISILMFSVLVHEGGHLVAALLNKVKVKVFSIGFFKPYIKKNIKGIEFRFTPWLLGGYVSLYGETEKVPNGFLSLPYLRKVSILLAGILTNLLVASVCYIINYKSMFVGLLVDLSIIKSMLLKDYSYIIQLLLIYQPKNLFLLQLSVFNMFCALFNLIPFPALDGSLVWMMGVEKILPLKKFVKFLKYTCYIGFTLLLIFQFIYMFIYLY